MEAESEEEGQAPLRSRSLVGPREVLPRLKTPKRPSFPAGGSLRSRVRTGRGCASPRRVASASSENLGGECLSPGLRPTGATAAAGSARGLEPIAGR